MHYAMAYAKFNVREWVKWISVLESGWNSFIDNIVLNRIRSIKTNNI